MGIEPKLAGARTMTLPAPGALGESNLCVGNKTLSLGGIKHTSTSSLEVSRGMHGLKFYPVPLFFSYYQFSLFSIGRGVDQNGSKAEAQTSCSFAVAESGYLLSWLGLGEGLRGG